MHSITLLRDTITDLQMLRCIQLAKLQPATLIAMAYLRPYLLQASATASAAACHCFSFTRQQALLYKAALASSWLGFMLIPFRNKASASLLSPVLNASRPSSTAAFAVEGPCCAVAAFTPCAACLRHCFLVVEKAALRRRECGRNNNAALCWSVVVGCACRIATGCKHPTFMLLVYDRWSSMK